MEGRLCLEDGDGKVVLDMEEAVSWKVSTLSFNSFLLFHTTFDDEKGHEIESSN